MTLLTSQPRMAELPPIPKNLFLKKSSASSTKLTFRCKTVEHRDYKFNS